MKNDPEVPEQRDAETAEEEEREPERRISLLRIERAGDFDPEDDQACEPIEERSREDRRADRER